LKNSQKLSGFESILPMNTGAEAVENCYQKQLEDGVISQKV
jgi:hypothetical protein